MDTKQIKNMGKHLNKFSDQFDDCFSRSESRQNLQMYVKGQLSELPRKSIEILPGKQPVSFNKALLLHHIA